MSIEKTLNVQKREGCGKGPNGRLRAQKLIPGVFYTGKAKTSPCRLQPLPLEKMYDEMGHTTVFNLEIVKTDRKARIRC